MNNSINPGLNEIVKTHSSSNPGSWLEKNCKKNVTICF